MPQTIPQIKRFRRERYSSEVEYEKAVNRFIKEQFEETKLTPRVEVMMTSIVVIYHILI